MKLIVSDTISYCPNCGKSFQPWDRMSREDFFLGASYSCVCGTKFQFVPEDAIKETASKHGDAGQYW